MAVIRKSNVNILGSKSNSSRNMISSPPSLGDVKLPHVCCSDDQPKGPALKMMLTKIRRPRIAIRQATMNVRSVQSL
jgi:hypothetical protein